MDYKIDIQKLKKILEDPQEPITPSFMLTVVDNLIGLGTKEEPLEIDYAWFKIENKYKINIARKDVLSAALAFHANPVEFFANPNVFDKMSIAFNGHDIVTSIINQPKPEEATFAIAEAREILKNIWKFEKSDKYPLFPDVAKYVAAVYSHNGIVVFHPSLKEYQHILDGLDIDPDIKKIKPKIIEEFEKYEKNPKEASKYLLENRIEEEHSDHGFIKNNVAYLIAIDIYTDTLLKYTHQLLLKVKK